MVEEEKEILGHKFKMVDRGLDESEVYSFVESLTNQYGNFNEKLQQIDAVVAKLTEQFGDISRKLDKVDFSGRTNGHTAEVNGNKPSSQDFVSTNGHRAEVDGEMEYLSSLAKFAERTIVEAAKRAKSIEWEIETKARARAEEIIGRAKEQAGAGGGAAGAGLEAGARERAEEIIAAAQRKAQDIIRVAESQAGAAASSAEAEEILSVAKKKAEKSAKIAQKEIEQLMSSAKNKKLGEDEVREAFEKIQGNLQSLAEVFEQSAEAATEERVEAPEPVEDKVAPVEEEAVEEEAPVEEKEPVEDVVEEAEEIKQEEPPEAVAEEPQEQPPKKAKGGAAGTESFEGTVELILPPPVGLDRMLQLHKSLKHTPNIDVLNLGGSVDKGITIRVLLETPIPLLKVIAELPEIKEAREEVPEGGKEAGGDEASMRRVLITTW
ncbi:MAG TPA: hypothetical protein G4O13_04495 [Dehalococcoidia bacterium]|nr:hypothetical protein [Dehalococcoidia bacterium]